MPNGFGDWRGAAGCPHSDARKGDEQRNRPHRGTIVPRLRYPVSSLLDDCQRERHTHGISGSFVRSAVRDDECIVRDPDECPTVSMIRPRPGHVRDVPQCMRAVSDVSCVMSRSRCVCCSGGPLLRNLQARTGPSHPCRCTRSVAGFLASHLQRGSGRNLVPEYGSRYRSGRHPQCVGSPEPASSQSNSPRCS